MTKIPGNRTPYPSRRWMSLWEVEHRQAGGWDGPVTLQALCPEAVELYRRGATPRAAGTATARSYHLHSSRSTYMELAAC